MALAGFTRYLVSLSWSRRLHGYFDPTKAAFECSVLRMRLRPPFQPVGNVRRVWQILIINPTVFCSRDSAKKLVELMTESMDRNHSSWCTNSG
jgi:hypothetical protein